MQCQFSRSAVIAASPEAVFDFVTDQTRITEWSPEVVSSDVEGGGNVQAGAILVQRRRQGSREMTNRVEVVAHERPQRHAVKTRIFGVNALFTFTFAPDGEGTRAAFECDISAKGLPILWAGKMAQMIEKSDDGRLERLREAMARRA